MAFYNSLYVHTIQYYVETIIGGHHSASPTTIGVE